MSFELVKNKLNQSIARLDDEIASYRTVTMFGMRNSLEALERLKPCECLSEIADVRNELDRTLKALSHRLEVKRALEDALDQLRDMETFENIIKNGERQ